MDTPGVINERVPQTIFRAYDIRGIVDEELNVESVWQIARALGTFAIAKGERKMVVGRDGRLSGHELLQALMGGLLEVGCDVIDIGAVPTPVVYYGTCILPAHSGIVLTGSHNPSNYNGLKMVIAGKTLTADEIQQLYRLVCTGVPSVLQHGQLSRIDILDRYIERIISEVALQRPLKIVIDCGNGITGSVAPQLFKKLGCEVTALYAEVDGRFPNHHPDPSHVENLRDLIACVKAENADVGLAFDGDGDRLGVVTDKGDIIWADRQMMLFAQDVLADNPHATILFDVKCSRHLPRVIEQNGGVPLMWKTGHSLIKAKLRETGAKLAGEMSGHLFFNDRWYGFDDALYAGARFLECLSRRTESASELFAEMPDDFNTPELKLPVSEDQKFVVMDALVREAKFDDARITTIDGVRADFLDGWGLVRPSNTTPYLILRFEAQTQEALKRIQEQFRQLLLKINPEFKLPF